MRISKRTYLVAAFVGLFNCVDSTAVADSFQSHEAGTYPIRHELEDVERAILAQQTRLSDPAISPEEKAERMNCLKEYEAKKKQLQIDIESGKQISRMPGVLYLSATDNQCNVGLTNSAEKTAGH